MNRCLGVKISQIRNSANHQNMHVDQGELDIVESRTVRHDMLEELLDAVLVRADET